MSNSNQKPSTVPLSQHMQTIADSLQHIRTILSNMVREECYPAGMFGDISIVLIQGLDVTKALERLATK